MKIALVSLHKSSFCFLLAQTFPTSCLPLCSHKVLFSKGRASCWLVELMLGFSFIFSSFSFTGIICATSLKEIQNLFFFLLAKIHGSFLWHSLASYSHNFFLLLTDAPMIATHLAHRQDLKISNKFGYMICASGEVWSLFLHM